MSDTEILLPSKPKVVEENETSGVYEIDNLYPGYGHTLGNSLRRIILSSLPGAAITGIKIDGVEHEFSTIEGVKEDVITIILLLKRVRIKMDTDEPQTLSIKVKGPKDVTAGDIQALGQIEILNKDQHIATVTGKGTEFNVELRLEKGLGFVERDQIKRDKVEVGEITLDAIFTPIRRVSYDVENMRVGDKTNHNRLRISIETDGSISPRRALERSIEIMVTQLQAVFGYKGLADLELRERDGEDDDAESVDLKEEKKEDKAEEGKELGDGEMTEIMKTRVESLNLSTRTLNALDSSGIRTIGGLARKTKQDLMGVEGMGEKGLQEIKRALGEFGIILKD